MRTGVTAIAVFMVVVSGCGDDGATPDAATPDGSTPDAGADAGSGDAGAPVCRPSETPGCHETCQFFFDCLVDSGAASLVDDAFPALGFTGEGFRDCTGCMERCEAGGDDDASARSCFVAMAEVTACDAAADPTVAAGVVNACCGGEPGSPFCRDTCLATAMAQSDLSMIVPDCDPFFDVAVPPSCAGDCPEVTSATVLPVTAAGPWMIESVTFDGDGSFVVLGQLTSALDFGGGAITAPGVAAFVAAFDPAGAPRWSARLAEVPEVLGGSYFARRADHDAGGNLFVGGDLRATLDLGDGTLESAGGSDVLLASFTPDGALRWARRFGGPEDDFATELRVLDSGDVILTATFAGTVDFGGGALESAGGQDVVVARYDAGGAHVWSRRYGGEGDDSVVGFATHPSGELTITGGFTAGADFGDGPLTSAGMQDSYVARIADDGALRWVVTHGGEASDFGYQVASDGERAIVADYIGSREPVEYGPETAEEITQILAGYDADGALDWLRTQTHATERAFIPLDLGVEASGHVLLTAVMFGEIDLGGALQSIGINDALVARLGADGEPAWAYRLGGYRRDLAPYAHRTPSGELVVVGRYVGDLDTGAGVLTHGAPYLFLMRFAAE